MNFTKNKLEKLNEEINELYDKVNYILFLYQQSAKKLIKDNSNNENYYTIRSRLSKYVFDIKSFSIEGYGDGEYLDEKLKIILKYEDLEKEDDKFLIEFSKLNKSNDKLILIIEDEVKKEYIEILKDIEKNNEKIKNKKIKEVLSEIKEDDLNLIKNILKDNGVL